MGEVDTLFEDEHLLIVSKPAGMVVHPTYKNKSGTMLDILLAAASGWPADTRPSIVGRLDKLTSGIVVVAKSAAMHAALQRVMASRHSQKEYLAVVYGAVNEERGAIDLRLRHDPIDRRMIVASEDQGTTCLTRFERLAVVDAPRAGLSLLRCRLVTGRRHQIRVHLAARGWPIVGDPQYGEPRWSQIDDPALAATLQAFPRQALHAWRVAFTHPISGGQVTVEAAVPPDLDALLRATGLDALAALKGPPYD
jgi:23S rRNA pseudouridine1911/1915/1917 synthase